MKLFHWSRWMHVDVMYMKQACLTLLMPNLNQGPHVSKGVLYKFKLGLIFIGLTSIPSSLLPDYELEIIIIAWHILLKSKPLLNLRLTPRVLQPSPLWESRLEIQCERLLREEKHVIYFPIAVIALGYLTSEHQRALLIFYPIASLRLASNTNLMQ